MSHHRPPSNEEDARFWQHLALAGMIEGEYNGEYLTDTCGTSAARNLGTDIPEGPLENSMYTMRIYENLFNRGPYHHMLFTGYRTTDGTRWYEGILTGSEAKAIDEKMDDGDANYGRLLGLKERGSWALDDRCTLTAYDAGPPLTTVFSDYYLEETTARCVLGFIFSVQ